MLKRERRQKPAALLFIRITGTPIPFDLILVKRAETARSVLDVRIKKINKNSVLNAQAESPLIALTGSLIANKTGQRLIHFKLLGVADSALAVMIAEGGGERNTSRGHRLADGSDNLVGTPARIGE